MMRTFAILGTAAVLLLLSDCRVVEGERCNPLLFSDECGDGLKCIYPASCAVAYCCPPAAQIKPDTNDNCQACPSPDGGTD